MVCKNEVGGQTMDEGKFEVHQALTSSLCHQQHLRENVEDGPDESDLVLVRVS